MSVKEVKFEVLKVVCPICGAEFYGLDEVDLKHQFEIHLHNHSVERKLEKLGEKLGEAAEGIKEAMEELRKKREEAGKECQ